jgi:hypothetical protein
MTSLLEKVKARGHWAVRIRPTEYVERVGRLADLEEAVRTSAVELRGWDFPHYDYNEPSTRTSDYVEQGVDWRGIIELWRAYRSGQFLHISTLLGDWRNGLDGSSAEEDWRVNATLGVEDAISRFVEVYEFASRWARRLSFGEATIIECTLRGLAGRALELSPRRGGFRVNRRATQEEWGYQGRYQTAILLATPRELAVAPAIQLLEIFGFDITGDVVRDIQSELRS